MVYGNTQSQHFALTSRATRFGRRSNARMLAAVSLFLLAVNGAPQARGEDAPEAKAAQPPSISYARDVYPILRARCHGCHQPARTLGGLDLTQSARLFEAGDSGAPTIVASAPAESGLIAQITPDEFGEALMPQQGPPLTDAQIALLQDWISAGAIIDDDPASETPFSAENPPTYVTPPIIAALEVSPDGGLIAVSGNYEVLLLDAHAVQTGERRIVHRMVGRAQRIQSLAFSPDGQRLAAAGGSLGQFGELQIWKVTSGELLASHTSTGDSLFGVAWSPDGKRVACGGVDTQLHVIDAETGEETMLQGAHTDWVLDAVFSQDGGHVISGSRDQTLKLVDAASGRLIDNITNVSPGVPGGPIYSLARHPKLDMLLTGGAEGVPRTYRMHRLVERKIGDDNNLVRRYPQMPGRIFSVAFSPEGDQLAVASSDVGVGYVRVFNAPSEIDPPEEIQAIQRKTVDQRSPTESQQLTDYHDQDVQQLASIEIGGSGVYSLAFHPDGKTLYSGGSDGVIRVHHADNAEILASVVPAPIETDGDQSSTAVAVPSGREDAPQFLTDVMPLLAKLGCNAGTCHGAAKGQNGFGLSLRGYNPLADYRSLTDDFASRRTDRSQPEQSLMLLKATGAVPHGGGAVLQRDSRRYRTLLGWIDNGARYDAAAPRVASLDLEPRNPILANVGDRVEMRAWATYTDGSRRDVTVDAFIDSGNSECATADDAAQLTAIRRGEAAVLARYEGAYAATTLTVMGDRRGFQWSQQPIYNEIDELVDAKLQRMKIVPSGLCTDEQFLRRVYLDLTGLPPTIEQQQAFQDDGRESRTKRAAILEDLLGSEDFIEHWTNYWSDLLLVNGRFLGAEGASKYRAWIRQAVADNRPYDEFVYSLLTAVGSNREHPAASYFKALHDPGAILETTTQVFLGVRYNCNKCHDHPFERWTMDDYYGLGAFYANVRLRKDPESGDRTIAGTAVEDARPLYEIVDDEGETDFRHWRTGELATAQFPYTHPVASAEEASLRENAAAWLTAPENRYFARSMVNRIWAQLTGVGLIEPVDDIRAGNPPSNPELLDWLTRRFVEHDFDVRWLMRTICASRTYQLSTATNAFNADDRLNYSHAQPRRLSAEVLFDAIHRVVGATSRLPGVAPGTRAAALADSTLDLESGLLGKLGRPARESGCVCERSSELELGPVMSLINGPTFAAALADPHSELADLEASLGQDNELVRAVYLRILSRPPSDGEMEFALSLLNEPVNEQGLLIEARSRREQELAGGFAAWREAGRPIDWVALTPNEATTTVGGEIETLPDNSLLVTGAKGKGVYRISADIAGQRRIHGLRLEALSDQRLPKQGPGLAPNGNFVLSKLRVFLAPLEDAEALREVKLRTAETHFSQKNYGVEGVIDAKADTGWAVGGKLGRNHEAAFGFSRPRNTSKGARIVVELDQQHADGKHLLGRFRLSTTDHAAPLLREQRPPEIAELLKIDDDQWTEEQQARLYRYYLNSDQEFRELARGVDLLTNPRLAAVQDLAWALINSPAFLFNH